MRYSIRSLIEIIFNFSFLAICISWGIRAMVPSAFITSTSTPASSKPAMRARSTVASVWPARRNTPPVLAFKGNICPGFAKSSGLASLLTKCKTVLALSDAEIPVVQPSPSKSTDTVKAVSWFELFFCTIKGNSSFSQSFSPMGMQIRPRPWVAIKFIICGVTLRAAPTKSPSFSRSSSSTTIISLPFFISSMASGIVFSLLFIFTVILSSKISIQFIFSIHNSYTRFVQGVSSPYAPSRGGHSSLFLRCA